MRGIFTTVIAILLALTVSAQSWVPSSVSDMPMATANNAVCEGKTTVGNFMYSFGGIDTSKNHLGIHQKSFKYDITNDSWSSIPDLPDTLGKVASAASFVKGKIYIIGGYHVYQNGSEVSSSRVHIFDPATDSFLLDGAPVPVPIDDQVQCVWRDSLVYVITGWSNTTNVSNVQIYNPSTNIWTVGTAVPNNNGYKVFGSQGIIVNDTIYYYGGASTASNFPATSFLRVGVIDTLNPSSINWLPFRNNTNHPLYRLIALSNPDDNISFLGGSAISYNYNGISYAANQGVPPADKNVIYNPSAMAFTSDLSQSYPMDLRGYADISPSVKYICGGMETNQVVSSKAYKLTFMNTVGTLDIATELGVDIYPNPTNNFIAISLQKEIGIIRFEIIGTNGQIVKSGVLSKARAQISVEDLSIGSYFLVLEIQGEKIVKQISKK